MNLVYLGLGSNLGDREANLRAAIATLACDETRVLRVSAVYETEPVGFTGQADFLNAAVEVDTILSPARLLVRIQEIELSLGRTRKTPMGPRTVDIDLLLYDGAIIKTPELEVPHPRMTERRFVLAPLADLIPDFLHPIALRTVRQLLEAAPAAAVRRTGTELR